MRSLAQLLIQESPISLAREVVWRARRNWVKQSVLAHLKDRPRAVTFRNLPYYKPDATTFSETSRKFVTAFADEVCNGRYSFLGYGTVYLGANPQWNLDFVSGLDWPEVPLENCDCVRFDGSDVKVPYELSRLQFLPVLGKAYILTEEVRYRETAKDLLAHWIQKNPLGVGVNWSLAMEAALRGMSICFLLNLLSPFRPEEKHWLADATRSLLEHLVYVEAHIEFSHIMSSNHYLSNIVGLFCLSSFLAGPGVAEKRGVYLRRIESELRRQVYEDGGDYEASTGYHVLVTQMFTTVLLLLRASDATPKPQFLERVRRMYRLLVALASPSGQLPHVGDCDDGRVELLLDDLQQMSSLPNSERNSLRVSNLLGLGKSLFEEGTGSLEDAKWYGFTRHEGVSESALNGKFSVFPKSGIAVATARSAEILFFAVPNGIRGKGSHGHNDKLSVILRLDGEEVLCDSGTGMYTRDIAGRNRFRVTAAHNTVLVDGKEQNTIKFTRLGLFRVGNEASVSRIKHAQQSGAVFLQASHSGYSSMGVTHTRTIRLDEKKELATIEDHLSGRGRHLVELNFQLAPPWRVEQMAEENSEVRCRIEGPRNLEIIVSAPCALSGKHGETLISRTYGSTVPASRVRFACNGELPISVTTQLRWATSQS
jgi:Heparinase II/III-like protein/Heparinase II/III N-terminus